MKLYCDKTRARYAAKRELAKGDLGMEAREGEAFEIVERDGKFGWVVPASVQAPVVEDRPEPVKRKAREPALAFDVGTGVECDAISAAPKPARKRKAAAAPAPAPEAPANPEPPKAAEEALAPAWPTAFVPDTAAGEIAAREYGLLKTRERAVQAATAAGVSDPVITQTCRGDWIWRVRALDKVWRENAMADVTAREEQRKAKAAEAGREPGKPRVQAKAAAAFEAAEQGELPTPPDFSAETHKPFRKRLEELRQLVKAGDVAGLRAIQIKTTSTSPRALDRYRNLAVVAIEAQLRRQKAG